MVFAFRLDRVAGRVDFLDVLERHEAELASVGGLQPAVARLAALDDPSSLDGQFGGTRSGEVVQDSIGPIQPLDSILLRLLVLLLRFVLFCRTVVVSLRFLFGVVAALLHHPQIVGRPHVSVLRRQRPSTAGALFQGAAG